jgi:hypothetical protein
VDDNLLQGKPQHLAALLGLASREGEDWHADEMGAVFSHLWQADLADELAALGPGVSTRASHLAESHDPPIRTLGDLMQSPSPPVELLDMAREFAKACNRRRRFSLPPDVSAALYYLCIGAAAARCRRWITRLPAAEVRGGLQWVLSRDWLPPCARELAAEALKRLPHPPDAPAAPNS